MEGWNKMKSKILLPVIALLSVAISSACQHQPLSVVTGNLENGWYYIVGEDSIVPTPIVTVKEFGALRVDSDYYGMYSIMGKCVVPSGRRGRMRPSDGLGSASVLFSTTLLLLLRKST